ncbi:hypothetical protein PR202_ga27716 [Eleusine coracana subsp. coracana]|uniref:Secreted protein n=1 Tax=Eleusine coracana subsp. coracana TaxID=191504 RepID=A0AAV5DFH8_ELECO|nr:hypothetical protein PR202_ga27716 [Eleusine coracana subsp. coracana]
MPPRSLAAALFMIRGSGGLMAGKVVGSGISFLMTQQLPWRGREDGDDGRGGGTRGAIGGAGRAMGDPDNGCHPMQISDRVRVGTRGLRSSLIDSTPSRLESRNRLLLAGTLAADASLLDGSNAACPRG